MNDTFKPDERPPAPDYPNPYIVRPEDVTRGVVSSPFTPEQEARLREIAWGACVAYAEFSRQRIAGVAKHADETRRAFLEGGDQ